MRLLLLGLVGLAACAHAELRLPDVRQATDYTCSAAALQAVLAYYGREEAEGDLARELGATEKDGAPPEAIVRVARAHGVHAVAREGVSLDEVARAVRAGRPVVLAIQAWPDEPPGDWRARWDDGHYVVVVAVERDRIVVEDPSILGARGWLARAELEARWHDQDGARRTHRLAIFFDGTPAPLPSRPQHVD